MIRHAWHLKLREPRHCYLTNNDFTAVPQRSDAIPAQSSYFGLRITIARAGGVHGLPTRRPSISGTHDRSPAYLRFSRLSQVHVSRMMASPSGAESGPTGTTSDPVDLAHSNSSS